VPAPRHKMASAWLATSGMQAVGSQAAHITALRARVMRAETPEELSALWEELEMLKFCGGSLASAMAPTYGMQCYPVPMIPSWSEASYTVTPGPAAAASMTPVPLSLEVLFKDTSEQAGEHCDSTSAGSLTPPSSCYSSGLDKSPKPSASQQSPQNEVINKSPMGYVVRNTFVETIEDPDPLLSGFEERQVRSCPPTPTGSTDSGDNSLSVLTLAAERLQRHEAPSPAGPRSPAASAATSIGIMPSIEQEAAHEVAAVAPTVEASTSQLCVLRLAETLQAQEVCPAELPSMGSAGHSLGRCKPCAFVHTKGCNSGRACQFCHLCDHGSSKRRKKAWREYLRATYTAEKGRPRQAVEVLPRVQPPAFTSTTAHLAMPAALPMPR